MGALAAAGRSDITFVLAAPKARRGPLFMSTTEAPRAYEAASDEALMTWSASGDRSAFDAIVLRHGPFALRVAGRLTRNTHLAEDIAQEAMLRAWARARHFDPRRARFTTWLYSIVVNLCIDSSRKRRPEALPANYDAPDPTISVADQMLEAERQRALRHALDQLPIRQRAAVTLVYDEGLSGVEAALILGFSAKAVERLLARARDQLRRTLSDHTNPDEM